MRNQRSITKFTAAFLLVFLIFTQFAPIEAAAASFPAGRDIGLQYQAGSPQYQYDDQAELPQPENIPSRFIRKDGIYVNPEAEETNRATLMITGDLMCQYRQQLAAFQSDGTDYLTYEEVQEIIEQAGNNNSSAGNKAVNNKSAEKTETTAASPAAPSSYGLIPQPTGTWNFSASFKYVKDIFSKADLVIGNLETTVSPSSPLAMQLHTLEGRPYLNAPSAFLEALKYAGFDLLTMANNHNCDAGVRGIVETLDQTDRYGFLHTGLFSDKEDPRYLLVDVNGIKIGIVSYAVYYNKKEYHLTESGQDIMLNKYSEKKAKRDIRAAKKAGAEYVLAFLHCGTENATLLNSRQTRHTRTLANAGADYIIGSHPHVLQHQATLKTKDGRYVPILYSMGNFLSHMTRDGNKDTMILRLDLKKTLAKEKVKVKVPSSSKNTSKKKTATKTITRTKVSLTSQTYYPCRILDTLEETPYVLYPMLADSPDAVLEPSQREELFAAYLRIANLYRDSNLKLHPSAAAPFLPEPSPPNLEDSNTGSDIGSDSGSGAA